MAKITFKDIKKVVEGAVSIHAVRQWHVRKKIPVAWQIYVIKNMPLGMVRFEDFDNIFRNEEENNG